MNQILYTLGIPNLSPTPLKYIGFEDIKYIITHHQNHQQYPINGKRIINSYLINTLLPTEQNCLIPTTILATEEETLINNLMDNEPLGSLQIIIYGKHSSDTTTEPKYKQLLQFGFKNVFMYTGGLFEWLLLQDIYGDDEFPTTTKVNDILKYRPKMLLCSP